MVRRKRPVGAYVLVFTVEGAAQKEKKRKNSSLPEKKKKHTEGEPRGD